MKATSYKVVGVVERYADAAQAVAEPGECAIVERAGQQRQLVMRCPDGCGEILSVNLDPRSGPAWRIYKRRGRWSLYPSIDRTSSCFSHFILRNGRIIWADADTDEVDPEFYDRLTQPVLNALQDGVSASYVQLADVLGELPWDVLSICRSLVRQNRLSEGTGKNRGIFSVNV
jgi:hypothetical protein